MTTEPSQNPDFIRKHPKEGMEALEKESKLPLKGWENEVARAKEFGLEAAKREKYLHFLEENCLILLV